MDPQSLCGSDSAEKRTEMRLARSGSGQHVQFEQPDRPHRVSAATVSPTRPAGAHGRDGVVPVARRTANEQHANEQCEEVDGLAPEGESALLPRPVDLFPSERHAGGEYTAVERLVARNSR
eukprot:3472596-Rhodomonas_salina.1